MHKLPDLLITKDELQINIGDKCRCLHHQNQGRRQYCPLVINKSNFRTELVHDRNGLVEVKNYEWCCNDIRSRKYYILQHSNKIINDESSQNSVLLNKKKIYKIKGKFITHDLLIYLNEMTMNGRDKYVGKLIHIFY